jgi:CubicO group peptidase (beta-lactamase class C family)
MTSLLLRTLPCRLLAVLAVCATVSLQAQASKLPQATEQAVDAAVTRVLQETGVPSASIAIVKDGQIAYAKAYGLARREPALPATADMRYKIASNSKQLTAAAILLLAEQHKLSLDDKLARFFPKLTRAQDISLRQLLTHTSGYQDYYAPDYLPPYMQVDTTPQAILAHWAMQPLDFEPGTRYQYSNTGYVVLGQVVEKVSGQPLLDFLRQHVFNELAMRSPMDVSTGNWSPTDPLGHTQHALGPVREVIPEGRGWMEAAGELAMTASDLARWNIALMNGRVLKPASLKALTTASTLADGTTTRYALGLGVAQLPNGHRRWAHTGGAAGYLSFNASYPDDHAALTVLTNGEGNAMDRISTELEKLVLAEQADPQAEAALARAKQLFASLQQGQVDRNLITADLSGYFNATTLADFAASLGPLGALSDIQEARHLSRGGMTQRVYQLQTAKAKLRLEAYVKPDGRFDQYLVFAE